MENYGKMYEMHLRRMCFCMVDVCRGRKRDKWAALHIRNAVATKRSLERLNTVEVGLLKWRCGWSCFSVVRDNKPRLINLHIRLSNRYLRLIRSFVPPILSYYVSSRQFRNEYNYSYDSYFVFLEIFFATGLPKRFCIETTRYQLFSIPDAMRY